MESGFVIVFRSIFIGEEKGSPEDRKVRRLDDLLTLLKLKGGFKLVIKILKSPRRAIPIGPYLNDKFNSAKGEERPAYLDC